jgi:colanic acid biosynthesis glycosyl transferase WcaI
MARITLLNQYYAPDEAATAQMVADLGEALGRGGHDVVAIASNRSYANRERRYRRREVIDGVEVHRVWSTARGRGSLLARLTDYGFFFLGAAAQLLLGKRADVVIVLTTPPLIGLIALFASRLRGFRVVLWSMDVYPDVAVALGTIRSNSVVGRTLAAASRFLVRRVDVTVALGELMAARLREHGATGVEVVHNWADEASVVPRPISGHPLREQWGWSNRFVVAYSGNLGLAHEFETVLNAAQRLTETDPNVLFAFIGSGPRSGEVQQAAREIPNVEFHELVPRARLGETLTAADVHLVTLLPQMAGLVVPSKIYGVLAAGRPTIYVGPSAGEVHQIITEGRCGSAVMNDDVAGLVEAVSAYARNAEQAAREGGNGRQFFERYFTRRMGTDAFLRLVNRTIHRDPSR